MISTIITDIFWTVGQPSNWIVEIKLTTKVMYLFEFVIILYPIFIWEVCMAC